MGIREWWSALWSDTGPAASAPVPAATVTQVTEAVQVIGYDPDDQHSAAQLGSAYVTRLTQSKRDLPALQEERLRDLSYQLWLSNPLAKQVVRVVRDYVLGEGITVTATGDQDDAGRKAIQERIDAFWNDPDNNLGGTLAEKVLELSLFGEQVYAVDVAPSNGRVRLRTADISLVHDVIRDPVTATRAVAVVLKDPAGGPTGQVLKVIDRDRDPASRSYGRLVGLRRDSRNRTIPESIVIGGEARRYAGACHLFRINKVSTAARGLPDLSPLVDWIDMADQVLIDNAEREGLLNSFVWDVAIDSPDPKAIDEAKARYSAPPRPGSLLIHNAKEVWTANTPDLKMGNVQITMDLLIDYIANGAGVPKTWLSGTNDVNRANGEALSEPAFKFLTARQGQVIDMVRELVTFALDQAELAGRLETRPTAADGTPAPWPITVNAPELRPRDQKMQADALTSVADGLTQLIDGGMIDLDAGRRAAHLFVEALGLEVDYQAMVANIERETAEREAKALAMAQQAAAAAPTAAPSPMRPRPVAVGGDR